MLPLRGTGGRFVSFLTPVLKERLMSRSPRQSTTWLSVALAALTLLVAAPRPSAAQLERSAVSGTVVDQQGGVIPGVTVTATSLRRAAAQHRHRRVGLLQPAGTHARPLQRQRRAPGLQEGEPRQRPARRVRHRDDRLRAVEPARSPRSVTVTAEQQAAADRRHAAQDRRSRRTSSSCRSPAATRSAWPA